MKSVLVIDIPMTDGEKHLCDKCPIWNDNLHSCQYDLRTGHEGCPFRPMPKRSRPQDEQVDNLYRLGLCVGWNACIDYLEER